MFLFVNFCGFSFGAIPSTAVWEVRTTGDATNGGGFNSARGGTDYSQQDTAQLSLTDLACASNTTLTSATGGFTAAMVGNIIYIASGTNALAGYYEITAYTDTNTVTIDRTSATGGNMTDGVGKVGGASNHPQTVAPAIVAGNYIYVKKGTYVKVGANNYVLNYTVAGTTTAPIRWIGYDSARATRPIGANRPTFDGNSDTADVVLVGQNYNLFDSFIFTSGTDKGVDFSSSHNFYGVNLRITGNGQFGITRNNSSGSSVYLLGCEIDSNGNMGTYGSQSDLYLFYCYIHDNAGVGAYMRYDGRTHIINSITESNSGHGVRLGDDGVYGLAYILLGNIAYNNTGANNDGFNIRGFNPAANQHPLSWVANNASISNASYGFEGYSTIMSFFDFNAYHGNTTGGVTGITPSAGASDVTADPKFKDGAGGDFRPDTGSPLIGAGFDVSTFISGVTVGSTNIGVSQDNPDAGGGGAVTTSYGFAN
jgi:hypothetical protein